MANTAKIDYIHFNPFGFGFGIGHFEDEELSSDTNYGSYSIKRIIKGVSKKGQISVVVMFDDGEKVVVHLSPNDTDDTYSAVAYAITKKIFGNNSKFKKYVDKRLEVQYGQNGN